MCGRMILPIMRQHVKLKSICNLLWPPGRAACYFYFLVIGVDACCKEVDFGNEEKHHD